MKLSWNDRRVEVKIEALKSDIDAWKWHIDAFISRSTRRSRDRSLEVGHRRLEVAHRRVHLEIDAFISRSKPRSRTSTLGSGTSTRSSRDRRVEVEIEALKSDIDAWKWHIDAFISRSTRQCRDRRIDVGHRSLEVPLRGVDVEIVASISGWSNLWKRKCAENHHWESDCEICAKCNHRRTDAHTWVGCRCSKCLALQSAEEALADDSVKPLLPHLLDQLDEVYGQLLAAELKTIEMRARVMSRLKGPQYEPEFPQNEMKTVLEDPHIPAGRRLEARFSELNGYPTTEGLQASVVMTTHR